MTNALMTRRNLLGAAAATAALATTPAGAAVRLSTSAGAPLDALLFDLLRHLPEAAVYAGLGEDQLGVSLLNRFDSYDEAHEATMRQRFAGARDQVKAMAPSADRDVVFTLFDNALAASDLPYGRINPLTFTGHTPFVVNQLAGPTVDALNLMVAQQPVGTVEQAGAYLDKLADAPRAYAGVAAKIRADAAKGCVLPARLMPKTLAVIDETMATAPHALPVVASFRARLVAAGFAPSLVDALSNEAVRRTSDHLLPALASVRAALVDVAPTARAADGIWAQPEGDRFYAAQIQNLGDSRMSADAIFRIGLDEVARITGAMDAILSSQGYRRGSVGERMKAIAAEPRFLFEDSDAGRMALLESLRAQIAVMNKRMPDFLHPASIPHQPVEVRRVPLATEASAPGGYYDSPSLDGSRPGIYWINLRDMKAVSKLRLPTLTYHEAVPGHHLQVAVALNQGSQPLIRKLASFNAYAEGWALYAEQLAAELGLYADDPFGDLGRLQDELFRSVRLVVDTGLHAKRWSRDKAIAYAIKVTGNTVSRMTAEIERYMAWPGQALGYKLGMVRILELRAQSRQRLGARFDLRDFHDDVLGGGAVPMAVLADRVAARV